MEAQTEKGIFLQMLARTMGMYSKPLPEASMVAVWWDSLSVFPLRTVAAAFKSYCDENGEFAPVPAGIVKRCKLMDGRPTDDEAWAIALASRSEEDTIVWTSEIAQAFSICQPVLQTGDEVGARMAFKDAYNRLVSTARIEGKAAEWSVSLGWDAKKREAAITKAQLAGLLSMRTTQALLPNYVSSSSDEHSAKGMKRVKDELAKLQNAWEFAAERRAAEIQAQRDAEAARKREIAEQVANYESNVVELRPQ